MDPMDVPPADHGSDRYDYVEYDAPEGVIPAGAWLDQLLIEACADCRANLFLIWRGGDPAVREAWHVTVAHDDGCPRLAAEQQ